MAAGAANFDATDVVNGKRGREAAGRWRAGVTQSVSQLGYPR